MPRPEFDDPLTSSVIRYYMHGNTRPPQHKLESYAARFSSSVFPKHMLLAADVFIDLAMADPSEAGTHFEQAETQLNAVIDHANTLETHRFMHSYAQVAPLATQACLKRTELKNWRQAIQGSEVRPDYPSLLEGARLASHYSPYHHDAKARLIEFMPVLLAARALARGLETGRLSRTSLAREDHRQFGGGNALTNWDCGISSNVTATAYDKPEIRLDLKANQGRKGMKSLRRAAGGVIVVRAKSFGFSEPTEVVYSCVAESEGRPRKGLSSDELDTMTHELHTYIETKKFEMATI